MTEERYNGWKNYDTWSMALLIDNDQGLQEEFHEQVENFKKKKQTLSETIDWMEDWAYDWLNVESLDNNQQQFINSALGNVDYREIIMNEAELSFEDLENY